METAEQLPGEFMLLVPNRKNHHHQIFLCLPAGLDSRGAERFIAILQPGSMTDEADPKPLSGQWSGLDRTLARRGTRFQLTQPVRPPAAVLLAQHMAAQSPGE